MQATMQQHGGRHPTDTMLAAARATIATKRNSYHSLRPQGFRPGMTVEMEIANASRQVEPGT